MAFSKRIPIALALCGVAALAAVSPVGGEGTALPPEAAAEPVRGMTVSCPTNGREWGTEEMVATMRELKEMGVEWI